MWWEGDVAHLMTDRLSFFICLSVADERKCYLDVSFKN